MSFLAGDVSDVTESMREEAAAGMHPTCESCSLEICCSDTLCCPPERAGAHVRIDGTKTTLHDLCVEAFKRELAAADTIAQAAEGVRSAMATDPLLVSVQNARDVANRTLAAIEELHAAQAGSAVGGQLVAAIERGLAGRGKYPTENDFARNLAQALVFTFEIKVRA